MDVNDSLVMIENQGGEILEEEFQASQIVGGNAVVAFPEPVVAEPGSEPGAGRRNRIITHTVRSEETAESIAKEYGISLNTVLWANNLRANDKIKVGDVLTILPTTGVLHFVKSGDTVVGLAQKYDANGKEIVAYNGLEDSSKLSIGQRLIIPDGAMPAPVTPRFTTPSHDQPDSAVPVPPSTLASGDGFLWPTVTRHLSQGFRWGHTGVDIDNRTPNTPIYAAAAGTVEFSGWLGGYGNLVIVNHGNGLSTYYAHNRQNHVTKGQSVTKGQAVATMGSTGRSTGPHLHFEVRKNGIPQNPLAYF